MFLPTFFVKFIFSFHHKKICGNLKHVSKNTLFQLKKAISLQPAALLRSPSPAVSDRSSTPTNDVTCLSDSFTQTDQHSIATEALSPRKETGCQWEKFGTDADCQTSLVFAGDVDVTTDQVFGDDTDPLLGDDTDQLQSDSAETVIISGEVLEVEQVNEQSPCSEKTISASDIEISQKLGVFVKEQSVDCPLGNEDCPLGNEDGPLDNEDGPLGNGDGTVSEGEYSETDSQTTVISVPVAPDTSPIIETCSAEHINPESSITVETPTTKLHSNETLEPTSVDVVPGAPPIILPGVSRSESPKKRILDNLRKSTFSPRPPDQRIQRPNTSNAEVG